MGRVSRPLCTYRPTLTQTMHHQFATLSQPRRQMDRPRHSDTAMVTSCSENLVSLGGASICRVGTGGACDER